MDSFFVCHYSVVVDTVEAAAAVAMTVEAVAVATDATTKCPNIVFDEGAAQ